MIHYILAQVDRITDTDCLLKNDLFGIQAMYSGIQKKGEFYLYPHIDDNTKTILYFAFDTYQQKVVFQQMLKISWVGPKTAFGIANMNQDVLQHAVESFDIKSMQNIPGVWPKTAKRLLVELKSTITKKEISHLVIDDAILRSLVSAMKAQWYDTKTVKSLLQTCPIACEKENIPSILKWLIQRM